MYKKLIAVIVLVACSTAVMAQKTFSGKILDSSGAPIPGATGEHKCIGIRGQMSINKKNHLKLVY
jgi:hypothetical protein